MFCSSPALAAYFVALSVVDRQRHGGIPRLGLVAVAMATGGGCPAATNSPVRLVRRAQAWIEWRRNGAVLPVCVAFAILLIVGPISWINGNGPGTTVRTLAWIIALPIGLAGRVGQGFSKPDLLVRRPFASGVRRDRPWPAATW